MPTNWPRHPSARYELPIPFAPGTHDVNDDYREGYGRVFGETLTDDFCGICGFRQAWCTGPHASSESETDVE